MASSVCRRPRGHSTLRAVASCSGKVSGAKTFTSLAQLKASGPVSQGRAGEGGRFPARLASSLDRGAAGRAGTCRAAAVGAGENDSGSAGGDGGAFGDPSGCCRRSEGSGQGEMPWSVLPRVHGTLRGAPRPRAALRFPVVFRGTRTLAVPSGRREPARGSTLRQRKGAGSAAGLRAELGSRFSCSERCKH